MRADAPQAAGCIFGMMKAMDEMTIYGRELLGEVELVVRQFVPAITARNQALAVLLDLPSSFSYKCETSRFRTLLSLVRR